MEPQTQALIDHLLLVWYWLLFEVMVLQPGQLLVKNIVREPNCSKKEGFDNWGSTVCKWLFFLEHQSINFWLFITEMCLINSFTAHICSPNTLLMDALCCALLVCQIQSCDRCLLSSGWHWHPSRRRPDRDWRAGWCTDPCCWPCSARFGVKLVTFFLLIQLVPLHHFSHVFISAAGNHSVWWTKTANRRGQSHVPADQRDFSCKSVPHGVSRTRWKSD